MPILTLPLLGSRHAEPYADGLLAGFDTYPWAVLDVIFGRFSPVGNDAHHPSKDDSVLKVSPEGVCISPNDVPGYDKDKYMPEKMKDENGKSLCLQRQRRKLL